MVVVRGLTTKSSAELLQAKAPTPLSIVTVYGAVPSVTTIFKVLGSVSQIVLSPERSIFAGLSSTIMVL